LISLSKVNTNKNSAWCFSAANVSQLVRSFGCFW
jgi:hypothetical protein